MTEIVGLSESLTALDDNLAPVLRILENVAMRKGAKDRELRILVERLQDDVETHQLSVRELSLLHAQASDSFDQCLHRLWIRWQAAQ